MQQILLSIVVMVFWAGLYLFVPVLSPYASSLGADLSLIGVVVGSYGVTQLILRIPAGWLSDRLGVRKPFVTAGFVITAASSLVMYWAPSPWYLVIGRALSGVSATMWVMLSVLFAGAFPPEKAMTAMGLASFATNIGQVAATPLGGWVANRWGMRVPFLLSAGVAAAGALLMVSVTDSRSATGRTTSLHAIAEALRSRPLLVVSALAALSQYVAWVTVFGFTPVYAQSLGASPADLGWLSAASLIPQALLAFFVGRIEGRYGASATLLTGFGISILTTAAIPFTRTLPLLMGLQVIGGLGRGLTLPVLMGLSIRTVSLQRRAMVMGIFQSLYAIGMFVGPVVAGVVGRLAGMTGLFLSTAGVGILAVVGLLAERHRLEAEVTEEVRPQAVGGESD